MSLCKFCLEEKRLCKAHLLPKSIIKRIGNEKQTFISAELHNLKNHRSKQDDYWDKDILCSSCDNLFSPIEKYFSDFINSRIYQPDRIIKKSWDQELMIYQNVDETKLRLFPLIVLWRLSVSKTRAALPISLGPLEKLVYDRIKQFEPGPYDFFPFTLYSFKDVNDGRAQFIGDPLPLKMNGGHCCILPLSDFFLMIRSGKDVRKDAFPATVTNGTLEVINLKGKTATEFLDAIYSSMPRRPRMKI